MFCWKISTPLGRVLYLALFCFVFFTKTFVKMKKKSNNLLKFVWAALRPLTVINLNVAGIDVVASAHYVWVGLLSEESVRCFGTFTQDLEELSDWLVSLGVESVAMEPTGIYWVNLDHTLESPGLKVCLANARYVRSIQIKIKWLISWNDLLKITPPQCPLQSHICPFQSHTCPLHELFVWNMYCYHLILVWIKL